MLKKLGLPMIALAGLLTFAAPQKADAKIHFGIGIGGPVYTAPVPPAYPYNYNYYPYDYGYAYPYVAPAYPYAYDYPYYGGSYFGFGFGGHHHDYDRGGHFRVEHGHAEHGGHRR